MQLVSSANLKQEAILLLLLFSVCSMLSPCVRWCLNVYPHDKT